MTDDRTVAPSASGEFRLPSVESRTFDLWRLDALTPAIRRKVERRIRALRIAVGVSLADLNARSQTPAVEPLPHH